MNSAVRKPDPAEDQRWMRAALLQARYALGQTAPNPGVGCVLVNNGVLVGRGRTAPGGRPHAETIAIQDAGNLAQNATAYVTLEPCSHHGQTPPCVDALITAGISRVVIAAGDPEHFVPHKRSCTLHDQANAFELVGHALEFGMDFKAKSKSLESTTI